MLFSRVTSGRSAPSSSKSPTRASQILASSVPETLKPSLLSLPPLRSPDLADMLSEDDAAPCVSGSEPPVETHPARIRHAAVVRMRSLRVCSFIN